MSDSIATLSVEEVARLPQPGMVMPVSVAFTSDDRVTFLDSSNGTLVRQLYVWDPTSGARTQAVAPPGGGISEQGLSLEEQLRRERMRERGQGITRYSWSKDGAHILVPIRRDVWIQDGTEGTLERLIEGTDAPVQNAVLCDDASQIAWVQNDELYAMSLDTRTPRQLTTGARGTGKTNGLPDYIAQEEMDRYTGFWWSKDSQRIAFIEVDETHIPIWRIAHPGKDVPTWEDHRYPFAGAENARIRLGVVPAEGGSTVWMDLTAGGQIPVEYVTRVHWMPDGRLIAWVQDRKQCRQDLVSVDPATGVGTILLTEHTPVWHNLHHIWHALSGDRAGSFLWATERTGFRHLVIVSPTGELSAALTAGDWQVDAVQGVDKDRGLVYFTASKDGPLHRHLYSVPLNGGEIRRITTQPGLHSPVLNRSFTQFVDTHHSTHQPPRVVLCDLTTGAEIAAIHEPTDARLDALDLTPPKLVQIPARDGTLLDAAIYQPKGAGPFPTLVHVYGGPHAQMVIDGWNLTADMRDQWLCSQGWLIIRLDNRGATRRGLQFEGAIRHNMGELEVYDQQDGVNWLVDQGLTDPERVGIFGWSYGGYMSAMALARAPETFKAAVAGAPVTHWDGYDTHYTERYMGTPQDNADGYANSAVMAHLEGMTGELLLVHGMIDENVHFRHTARLINGLVRAGKRYQLLAFPDERHVPRGIPDRIYMEESIRDFFVAALS